MPESGFIAEMQMLLEELKTKLIHVVFSEFQSLHVPSQFSVNISPCILAGGTVMGGFLCSTVFSSDSCRSQFSHLHFSSEGDFFEYFSPSFLATVQLGIDQAERFLLKR